MMLMVCIHGAPGVGKLSAGLQLEKATGFILIHDHLVIESAAVVFEFGKPGFSALRSKLFSDLLDAACSTHNGIILTHANDIFWQPSFQAMVRDYSKRYSYGLKHIMLCCSHEEHAKRISDPRRTRYRKIIDIERLQCLTEAGEFRPPSPDEGDISIDTTYLSPVQVAAEIAFTLGLVERKKLQIG